MPRPKINLAQIKVKLPLCVRHCSPPCTTRYGVYVTKANNEFYRKSTYTRYMTLGTTPSSHAFCCPPPHEVRKGGYWIRHRPSVRPSVHFVSKICPISCTMPQVLLPLRKHHYTIKAGDTRRGGGDTGLLCFDLWCIWDMLDVLYTVRNSKFSAKIVGPIFSLQHRQVNWPQRNDLLRLRTRLDIVD